MICKVDKGTELADMLLNYVESCSWDESTAFGLPVRSIGALFSAGSEKCFCPPIEPKSNSCPPRR